MTYFSAFQHCVQFMIRLNARRPHLGNRGVAMVEFGIVGPIFLLMILIVLQFGLQLFEQVMLDYALHGVARQVQLGTVGADSDSIQKTICGQSTQLYDCSEKLSIKVWSGASTPPMSFNGANLTSPLTANGKAGSSGSLMIVDATYITPYIVPWLNQIGSASGQGVFSRSVFQNEPY